MSVTKIILRHNRTGAGTLPLADSSRCSEPLWFKNKLYIRSQNAEEIVNPNDYGGDTAAYLAAVEQFRQTYQEGNPILIGPYEHPKRQTGSQLAVNVSEDTQSQNEDYIYTSHSGQSITDMSRTYRALTGIVTDKDGHIITAEAGLNLQLHSWRQFLRFWDGTANGDQNYTPITISTSGTGSLPGAPNISTKFSLPSGVGHLETTGKLLSFAEAVTAETTTAQNGYTWSLQTGDCIPVTDADWASHMAMGAGIDGVASYNHQLVRSNISFDTNDHTHFLARDGQWRTPEPPPTIAASTGDTTVKGVIAGSVEIDSVKTEFTVQPANSFMGAASSEYYYTGQGVVRPLGTTTGILDQEGGKKVLFAAESTAALDQLTGNVMCAPDNKGQWAAIPVYVDYHKVPGTNRVEAVPYILLPWDLIGSFAGNWDDLRSFAGGYTEKTRPEGRNDQSNPILPQN